MYWLHVTKGAFTYFSKLRTHKTGGAFLSIYVTTGIFSGDSIIRQYIFRESCLLLSFKVNIMLSLSRMLNKEILCLAFFFYGELMVFSKDCKRAIKWKVPKSNKGVMTGVVDYSDNYNAQLRLLHLLEHLRGMHLSKFSSRKLRALWVYDVTSRA